MARRLSERVLDHNGRDVKSHLVKHAIKKCHKHPKIGDFNVIGKGYRRNTFKRKVAESLLIKDVRSFCVGTKESIFKNSNQVNSTVTTRAWTSSCSSTGLISEWKNGGGPRLFER